MVKIFRSLWAVYGVLLFLLMMLLSIPYILFNMLVVPGKKALRRNIWFLHHPFTKVFFTLTGVRIKVHGQEHIDPTQSYVIVCNHQTAVDFIANGSAFPGIFRFLAKQELQKIPIFGFVVKKMCLTVDRKNAMSRARSVVNLKKELEEGVSVLIYPEGSRNKTNEALGPFYDGAFRIAIQTKAPVLPMTILNVESVCRPGEMDYCPGVLHIRYEAPITTDQLKGEDVDTLKDTVRNLLIQRIEEYKRT